MRIFIDERYYTRLSSEYYDLLGLFTVFRYKLACDTIKAIDQQQSEVSNIEFEELNVESLLVCFCVDIGTLIGEHNEWSLRKHLELALKLRLGFDQFLLLIDVEAIETLTRADFPQLKSS